MKKARTAQKWKRHEKVWMDRLFTPRLTQDLIELPTPEDLPSLEIPGEGIFLYGEVESGKTVYGAQVLLETKKQHWLDGQDEMAFLFASVPDIFAQLKHSFEDSSEQTEHEILTSHQDVDFLMLDELGVAAKPSDWMLNILYLIINHRYEHLKPTIFTSNKSLEELADIFGDDRIPSRIRRMGKVLKKKHWEE